MSSVGELTPFVNYLLVVLCVSLSSIIDPAIHKPIVAIPVTSIALLCANTNINVTNPITNPETTNMLTIFFIKIILSKIKLLGFILP